MLVPPPPPLREPLPIPNPPNLSCLSKKSAVGCLSYTISEDCTDGHLVRRKRLCAFEGPGLSKRLGDGRQRRRMNPNEDYDGKRSPVDLLENSSHDLPQERSKPMREKKSRRLSIEDGDLSKIMGPLPAGVVLAGFSNEDEDEAEDSPRPNASKSLFSGAIEAELSISGQYAGLVELKRQDETHYEYRKCPVVWCDKVFRGSDNMEKHMQAHQENPRYPFFCTVNDCYTAFVSKEALQRHHQTVHRKEGIHKCDYCGRLFARQDSMRRHQQHGCAKRPDITSPGIRADFGPSQFVENARSFTFKNLPVLEKANKDVIQKLRAEALAIQNKPLSPPRGIKVTSRLEALANRPHAWKPTAGVLNLGSQHMPHRAQQRQDAPHHIIVGDMTSSDTWDTMEGFLDFNSNTGPSKV